MKKILISIFTLMLFTACGTGSEEENGKLQVTTTIGMIADMVQNIGGENVEVTALMGPGVDPHLYKASAGDIRKIEDADVVFYGGHHLESKMVEIFEQMKHGGNIIALAETLPEDLLIEAGGDTYDPHVWFNVELWSMLVDDVTNVLVQADPENAEIYKENARQYLAELQALHQWVLERVSELPEEKRILVTAHDAFSYFGQAYGFRVEGLQGISTASDYGLKDLSEVIDLIVENEIKAIFVESSVSPRSIEALKEGTLSRGHQVEIGGELYSDAMGAPDTEEGTYIGMVRYNVNTIVDALK